MDTFSNLPKWHSYAYSFSGSSGSMRMKILKGFSPGSLLVFRFLLPLWRLLATFRYLFVVMDGSGSSASFAGDLIGGRKRDAENGNICFLLLLRLWCISFLLLPALYTDPSGLSGVGFVALASESVVEGDVCCLLLLRLRFTLR